MSDTEPTAERTSPTETTVPTETTENTETTEATVPTEATEDAPAVEEAGAPEAEEGRVTHGADDAQQAQGQDDGPGSSEPASGRVAGLEREGEVAADFLETLLDIADLDGDLEVDVEGDRAAVSIVDSEDGPAPQRLVGRGGEVLEALQELTRLAVQAETGDRSRLMLDVAGYRAGRRAELVQQAREVIAEVKAGAMRGELPPMSAFERKVVHDEVLAAGLASESEGQEPNRYVVVLPAS